MEAAPAEVCPLRHLLHQFFGGNPARGRLPAEFLFQQLIEMDGV
jgi:hypothetical protein